MESAKSGTLRTDGAMNIFSLLGYDVIDNNSPRSRNLPTATVTIPMPISAIALASSNVNDRYLEMVSVTKTTANLRTEESCRAPFDVAKMLDETTSRAAGRLGG